jgi:hypothetical protein
MSTCQPITPGEPLVCSLGIRLSLRDYARLTAHAARLDVTPAQACREILRATLPAEAGDGESGAVRDAGGVGAA